MKYFIMHFIANGKVTAKTVIACADYSTPKFTRVNRCNWCTILSPCSKAAYDDYIKQKQNDRPVIRRYEDYVKTDPVTFQEYVKWKAFPNRHQRKHLRELKSLIEALEIETI